MARRVNQGQQRGMPRFFVLIIYQASSEGVTIWFINIGSGAVMKAAHKAILAVLRAAILSPAIGALVEVVRGGGGRRLALAVAAPPSEPLHPCTPAALARAQVNALATKEVENFPRDAVTSSPLQLPTSPAASAKRARRSRPPLRLRTRSWPAPRLSATPASTYAKARLRPSPSDAG